MRSATCAQLAALRDPTTISAPSRCQASAPASPVPLEAPVTSRVRPARGTDEESRVEATFEGEGAPAEGPAIPFVYGIVWGGPLRRRHRAHAGAGPAALAAQERPPGACLPVRR